MNIGAGQSHWERRGIDLVKTSVRLRDQSVVRPPSTFRMYPTIWDALSDAMRLMVSATSSLKQRRLNGTCTARAALLSGVPVKRVYMPVSVGPGAPTVTRIPELAIPSATDLLNPSKACVPPT